jgi:hypothetical protein
MEVPWGNIVTAIAAVVAVVIANRLSYGRSNKEKLWDLRRQAYGLILSELSEVEQICDSADEYIQQDEDRYFESVDQKDNFAIAKHMEAINRRIADDYLILSDAFISMYGELKKEMSGDPYNDTPPEEHEKFSTAVRKYRPLLIALARGEMTVRNRWWSFAFLS